MFLVMFAEAGLYVTLGSKELCHWHEEVEGEELRTVCFAAGLSTVFGDLAFH